MDMIFLFLSISILSDQYLFQESYVILPRSLEFCKDKQNVRDLTITKQISLNFNGLESLIDLNDTHSLKFVCSVIVKPLGRRISLPYYEGTVHFWKLRFSLKMKLSCSSTLTMHFLKEDNIYEPISGIHELVNEDKSMVHNYSCHKDFSVTMNSDNRKLLIFWTTNNLSLLDDQMLDIQLSTYMRFNGSFNTTQKQRYCTLQYGFWCGSAVEVCINAQMHCDRADGCFDGGSDEKDCPSPRNTTYHGLNSRQKRENWSSYLPWIVLGILPLILIFSLALICNQRRQGLDSISSENDDPMNRNDKDDISYRLGEKRDHMSVDYVGGNEGFSIRYGGRIHRLSGDPRENNSLNSSESNIEWNETSEYLPQISPDLDQKSHTSHNEIHSGFLDRNEPIEDIIISTSKENKPKLYYKIGEFPGEISPTLTNGSSLNDNSPAGMRSQMSVVTYCGSERSCGIVRFPSGEEIMMKELISNTYSTGGSCDQLDEEGFCDMKVQVIPS